MHELPVQEARVKLLCRLSLQQRCAHACKREGQSGDGRATAHLTQTFLGEGLCLELLLADLEALHLCLNQLASVSQWPLVRRWRICGL